MIFIFIVPFISFLAFIFLGLIADKDTGLVTSLVMLAIITVLSLIGLICIGESYSKFEKGVELCSKKDIDKCSAIISNYKPEEAEYKSLVAIYKLNSGKDLTKVYK